jgi:hypothetical protein
MWRKDREAALGILVYLATAGMLFCSSLGCGSSTGSPVVADASPDSTADSSIAADAPLGADGPLTYPFCTGPAAGALIDDMSGSRISLAPPACGAKGAWYVGTWENSATSPGELTTPPGNPRFLGSCGDLCQSLYSPRPAGFPEVTSSEGDGGSPGPEAMCIAGHTGASQYDGAGMFLELAFSGTGPAVNLDASDGLASSTPPALIDASAYAGIEFWLWVSPETAKSVGASFIVQLVDKNQTYLGGVCDGLDTGTQACAAASAALSGSVASTPRNAGTLLADDGSELTALTGGWQHVRAPWDSFTTNPSWGGANELVVDPQTLAYLGFLVTQDSPSGPALAFDYCVYQLSFLPKSDVPVLDGGVVGAVDSAGASPIDGGMDGGST